MATSGGSRAPVALVYNGKLLNGQGGILCSRSYNSGHSNSLNDMIGFDTYSFTGFLLYACHISLSRILKDQNSYWPAERRQSYHLPSLALLHASN